MTTEMILELIRFLGLGSVLGGAMWVGFSKVIKMIGAVKLGTQASLRNSLVQLYEHYSELGYAPVWVRDNFVNMYTQYHSLGANGVMDDIYKKFLDLPVEQPKKEKSK